MPRGAHPQTPHSSHRAKADPSFKAFLHRELIQETLFSPIVLQRACRNSFTHRQPRRHAQALRWSLPVEGAPRALLGPARPDPALAASPDGRTCQIAGKTTGACKAASCTAPRATCTHGPEHLGSVLSFILLWNTKRVQEAPGELQAGVTHGWYHQWAAPALLHLIFPSFS